MNVERQVEHLIDLDILKRKNQSLENALKALIEDYQYECDMTRAGLRDVHNYAETSNKRLKTLEKDFETFQEYKIHVKLWKYFALFLLGLIMSQILNLLRFKN